MEEWTVAPVAWEHLRDYADRARPLESCGYLVGRGRSIQRFVPTKNLHEHPETRYLVDPMVYLDLDDELQGSDDEVVGIFHSHPATPAVPSVTDRAHAQPGWAYLILGFPPAAPEGELRAWWVATPEADFEERLIHVKD